MTYTNKLKKYATLKAQAKVLDAQIKELQLGILTDMENDDVLSEETQYGKFTYSTRTSYTYSDAVKKLVERTKVQKIKEEQKGTAKAKESHYLTYTTIK